MIEEEQLLVKGALELIGAAGGTGALKSKLFSALRNLDGTPLTPEQQDAVFCQLERRGWITSHLVSSGRSSPHASDRVFDAGGRLSG